MLLKTTELPLQRPIPPYRVLGLMSGTSMDALDMADSEFVLEGDAWTGRLNRFMEVPLPPAWPERFRELSEGSAVDWFEAERDWSRWCAQSILDRVNPTDFDAVVFSGQTIFHRPNSGWTGQLGSGSELYAALGALVPVISDLRSLDVALGGQGAPLVPVADALLFSEYEACLNLGGFANISLDSEGERRAWDIGPCNLVLNALAGRAGLAFDESGNLAHQGQIDPHLLQACLHLPYHAATPPKSLGTEWLESVFWPMLDAHEKQTPLSVSDALATASTYIAESIRRDAGGRRTLVTGGGVFNRNLMRLLEEPSSDHMPSKPLEVMVPEVDLVRGKEAHAFAFLGLLRLLGLPNVWPEVTGSKAAHVGGALWGHNAVSSRTPNAMQ